MADQVEPMNRFTKFFKEFWESLDIMKLLAILIVVTWLTTILAGYKDENETLKNIVLVIAGFLWGSSVSSRKKDDALAAAATTPTPAAPSAPVPPAG